MTTKAPCTLDDLDGQIADAAARLMEVAASSAAARDPAQAAVVETMRLANQLDRRLLVLIPGDDPAKLRLELILTDRDGEPKIRIFGLTAQCEVMSCH